MYIQGQAESQRMLRCGWMNSRIMPFEAYECAVYDDKRQPALSDMKQIAWVLRTEKNGGTIGFCSAKEWREKWEREEIPNQQPVNWPST